MSDKESQTRAWTKHPRTSGVDWRVSVACWLHECVWPVSKLLFPQNTSEQERKNQMNNVLIANTAWCFRAWPLDWSNIWEKSCASKTVVDSTESMIQPDCRKPCPCCVEEVVSCCVYIGGGKHSTEKQPFITCEYLVLCFWNICFIYLCFCMCAYCVHLCVHVHIGMYGDQRASCGIFFWAPLILSWDSH